MDLRRKALPGTKFEFLSQRLRARVGDLPTLNVLNVSLSFFRGRRTKRTKVPELKLAELKSHTYAIRKTRWGI